VTLNNEAAENELQGTFDELIERDLQAIEAEYAARGGQQAGTPRLRRLRASIEMALQHLAAYRSEQVKTAEHVFALFPMDSVLPMPGHEMSFIVHTTNALSDSRKAALVLAKKMKEERDAARELLGRELKGRTI
jgi:hypothetical protein